MLWLWHAPSIGTLLTSALMWRIVNAAGADVPAIHPYCSTQVLLWRSARGANFTRAAFEGSTHYALEGRWLASQLMELYPWIRIGEDRGW
jgi:hypothetical protein